MQDLSSASDKVLSGEIRSENNSAFKIIYYRYSEQLANFVYHRTFSEELTKDLIQEVFTRLWEKRKVLNPQKSLKAYLYRIANNLIIDHSRKHSSRKKYIEVKTDQRIPSKSDSLDTEISYKMVLKNLPKKLSTVFLLSRHEGLKYHEIAEACGISIKTVERRMSQALLLLQKELL